MGGSQSNSALTVDLLEDYTTLTYLGKGEILHLWKKFKSIDPEKVDADFNHRIHKEEIMNKFGALRVNPFSDRIFKVFSSKNDDCMSFEDLVDLSSAMSADCPPEVKAEWAFRIFDLDEDNQISQKDLIRILDRLVAISSSSVERSLDIDSKKRIAKAVIQEIMFDNSGTIGCNEFKYIMSRLPEFETSFYMRL